MAIIINFLYLTNNLEDICFGHLLDLMTSDEYFSLLDISKLFLLFLYIFGLHTTIGIILFQ